MRDHLQLGRKNMYSVTEELEWLKVKNSSTLTNEGGEHVPRLKMDE